MAGSAVALLGARHGTSPTPVATATPLPAYTALPSPRSSAAFAPSVVVYPFEITGEMPKNASAGIAQVFDQQLTLSGGLRVVAAPKNVTRSAYLTNARQSNADYYISGYLTPLGDGAAMVVQVVTADSGIMIFSKTAQIFSTSDASAQAELAREVMLAHSGQLGDYNQAQPSATPAPEDTAGASVPLGGLFGVFKHGGKGNTSTPSSVAAQDKPSRIAIVANVSGTGIDAGTLASAKNGLGAAMNRYFTTQLDQSNASDIADAANTICGSNRNATIAGGTLAQQRAHGKLQSVFTLRIYTCFGAVLYQGAPVTAGNVQTAITNAVTAYATANPTNS